MKPEGATKLRVVPVTIPVANRYVTEWHRHHAPLVTVMRGKERLNKGFAWFALACASGVEVVGVAIVGRPTNRNNGTDGQTLEVLRVATDGHPNAASCLLGACAKTARAMGAARILTYTLESESGTSLKASGWVREADGIATCWTKGKGKARPGGSGNTIWRPHMDEAKVRWALDLNEAIPLDLPADLDDDTSDQQTLDFG